MRSRSRDQGLLEGFQIFFEHLWCVKFRKCTVYQIFTLASIRGLIYWRSCHKKVYFLWPDPQKEIFCCIWFVKIAAKVLCRSSFIFTFIFKHFSLCNLSHCQVTDKTKSIAPGYFLLPELFLKNKINLKSPNVDASVASLVNSKCCFSLIQKRNIAEET